LKKGWPRENETRGARQEGLSANKYYEPKGAEMQRSKEHLTEEELALYVDAIFLDRADMVEDRIRDHVMQCHRCKKELLEIRDLTEGDKEAGQMKEHPFFGRTRPSSGS
jgi:hypothetical protein